MTIPRKRVAIYERVSTEGQSVEMQDSDLKRYCEQRKLDIYHIYIDHGVSGTRERRLALDQLMADARKGKFQVVLVWRFDRWARSSKHLVVTLEELHHLGIEFISYQENIDTGSPLGKAMFVIVAAIAELERNIIVERIKGGLRRAKAMGRQIGRPGLKMNIERIVSLQKQGWSIRTIAKEMGASPSFIHKVLKATHADVTGE